MNWYHQILSSWLEFFIINWNCRILKRDRKNNREKRLEPERMTDCYVAGWGNDAEGGDSHDYLQSLTA